MGTDEYKVFLRRYIEQVWERGNLVAVNQFVATRVVQHDPALPNDLHGPTGMQSYITLFRTAMPDWQFTMEDVIAEGARIAIRWSAHGTQHGPLLGVAPTGKPLHLTGISIYHLVGRTIVEGWTSWDTLSVLRQLGRFPALERVRGGAAMPNVM